MDPDSNAARDHQEVKMEKATEWVSFEEGTGIVFNVQCFMFTYVKQFNWIFEDGRAPPHLTHQGSLTLEDGPDSEIQAIEARNSPPPVTPLPTIVAGI